jgi:hypothetical protein
MIRKEVLGMRYSVTYNSMKFEGVIEDDKKFYKLYKVLGLDVFETKELKDVIVRKVSSKRARTNAKRKNNGK